MGFMPIHTLLLRIKRFQNIIAVFCNSQTVGRCAMKQIKAILFDLDGTLIDTTDLILRCFAHTWQNVCGISHSREDIVATFGMPLRIAMHRLLANHQLNSIDLPVVSLSILNDEVVEQLLTTYRTFNVTHHDSLARPFEKTEQVVSMLRLRGYAIGVVTSKSRELAIRGLQLCKLDELIDEAIFMEDTLRHKPEPEPILAALEKFQIKPGEAVYVGDSFHDIVAGRAAGVKTIAAAWGPMPRAELERERPDLMVESIADLLNIFD
jgi:pyrophosphatase PpaX